MSPRLSQVDERSEATRLRFMRRVNPRRWAERVRAAMRDAHGRIPDAAATLGVHERTLYRWLHTPDPETAEPLLVDAVRVPTGVRRTVRAGRRRRSV